MRIVRTRRVVLPAALAVVLAAGTAVLIAALASGDSGTVSTPGAAPRVGDLPTSVAETDPDAVCAAFARSLLTVDTALDPGPDAAYRRSMPYLQADLADAVATQPGGRDAAWAAMRAHQAVTAVRVAPLRGIEAPPDTGTRAYRAVLAVVAAAGRDGWVGQPRHVAVYCGLRTVSATELRWRISGYELADRTVGDRR